MSQRTPQTLHIFRKDTVHLWPEILISFAILAAFAWANIVAAQAPAGSGLDPATAIAWILRFLTPIVWMVLLSRLVHDEELVGDRQFWITRPYNWPSLLLSKILFCAVFILLPFAIMQAFLLHHAHLYPTLSLPATGHVLLMFSIAILLPLFAIAAVTINFVRYMMFALAGLLYAIAAVAIGFWQFPDHFTAPYMSYLMGSIFVLLPIAAVLVSYARRNTLVARVFLLATPVVFVLAGALAPIGALVAAQYPDKSFGTLAFDSAESNQQPSGRLFLFRGKATVQVPVNVTLQGTGDKFAAEAKYINATFTATDGSHYATGWQPIAPFAGQSSLATGQPANLAVMLPESAFNRFKGKQVSLHLDVAAEAIQTGTPYNILATEKPFPVPGHGNCAVSVDDGTLGCNYAYEQKYPVELSSTVHPGDCLTPGPQSAVAHGFLRPVSSTFDPVATTRGQLMLGQHRMPLCPNTPITLTPTTPFGYGRFHVDVQAINLDNYALHLQVKDPNAAAPAPPAEQQQ